MGSTFVGDIDTPQILPDDSIYGVLLREYERVVVESLITSFGLDFLFNEVAVLTGNDSLATDSYGGDVDTIHNVRKIGIDANMSYKSKDNEAEYARRGEYVPYEYHGKNLAYQATKGDARRRATEVGTGTVEDAYTRGRVAFTKGGTSSTRADLDHVLSAKSIHDDRGRVLAEVDGPELANDQSNLQFTNQYTNRSMGADSIPEWLEKHPEVGPEQRARMMAAHEEATHSYEARIATAYYTSPRFARDLGKAAGKRSAQMAARQVCGLVFSEAWFAVKERLSDVEAGFDPAALMSSIGLGIREGFARAKDRYRDLLARAAGGALSGALASVTNTLVNIFFTTAKSFGKVLRECYASLVDAARVLIVNPEGYLFGDRLRVAAKVLATGASVVLGTAVADAVSRTPVAAVPHVGEAVQTFCGALVTGSLTCTLLLYLDRSAWINKLVARLNEVPTVELGTERLRRQAECLTRYAAELAQIDYRALESEISMMEGAVARIADANTPQELNLALRTVAESIGAPIPWEGDFDGFMADPNARLRFG